MVGLLLLIVIAATPASFRYDLAKAQPGDRIVLSPGVYGELLIADRKFQPLLTIDARRAWASVRIQNAQGVTIHGGLFTPDLLGRGVTIDQSRDVWIFGGTVDGARDAVGVTRSQHVSVQDVTTKRIVGNGFSIAGSRNVSILRGKCLSPRPDPTGMLHPDCVQGWPMAGYPTTDVLVSGVVADGAIQGIFFNDVVGGGTGFERVRVIGNTIVTKSAPNGIALFDCRQCSATDNKVGTAAGSRWQTRIYVSGGSVQLERNSVAAYKDPK